MNTKQCSYCDEKIPSNSSRCQYCNEWVGEQEITNNISYQHKSIKFTNGEKRVMKWVFSIFSGVILLLVVIIGLLFYNQNEKIKTKSKVTHHSVRIDGKSISGGYWSSYGEYFSIPTASSGECYFVSSDIRSHNNGESFKTYFGEHSSRSGMYNFADGYNAKVSSYGSIYFTKYSNGDWRKLTESEKNNLYFAADIICVESPDNY